MTKIARQAKKSLELIHSMIYFAPEAEKNFTALGLEPVPVETAEGRAAYAAAQRDFATRSAPLRRRLVDVLEPLATSAP